MRGGIDLNAVAGIIAILAIPVVFAITLHEVAHGWAAKQLGDSTAFRLGRLSLNPIRHVDPIGTIIVPIGMAMLSGGQWYFGWAKPVPVAFQNLRNPRRDMILVAAAGPGANLVMATLWTIVYAAALGAGVADGTYLTLVCRAGIHFNLLLMIFNLLPIPPLDGGRVLAGLLPPRAAASFSRIEPFGFIIVLVLLLPPLAILGRLLDPPLDFFELFFYQFIRT
jgi:Zn-dependent protease